MKSIINKIALIFTMSLLVVVVNGQTGTDLVYFVDSEGIKVRQWGEVKYDITKLDSLISADGDGNVAFYFNKGDTFNIAVDIGASGTAASQLIIGAYGVGDNPKIYGSDVIDGWIAPTSGYIYKAYKSQEVTQLFDNDTLQAIARFPNTGWATLDTVKTTTSFVSNELDAGIDYTDARWLGKTQDWAIVARDVVSSVDKTITIESAPEGNLGVGEGFLLLNKLEFLDVAGEWCYVGDTVYYWALDSLSPTNVRGSVRDDCITISAQSYVTIEDLHLLQPKSNGIESANCSNITIRNNRIDNAEYEGVVLTGSTNNTVESDTINESNYHGIRVSGTGTLITGNTITNTALFDNLGVKGTGVESNTLGGTGIYTLSGYNIVRYNNILNTGYTGIRFLNKALVEYNYVNSACLVKDDGGGIYTWSANVTDPDNAGSIIRNNIVVSVIGTTAGTTNTKVNGYGIYPDDNSGEIEISGNTVAESGAANVFLHTNKEMTVTGNTFMDAPYNVYTIWDDGVNTITGNITYAKTGQYNIADRVSTNDHVYEGNTHIAHYGYVNTGNFLKTQLWSDTEAYSYTLTEWQVLGNGLTSTIDNSSISSDTIVYNPTNASVVVDMTGWNGVDGSALGSETISRYSSLIATKD